MLDRLRFVTALLAITWTGCGVLPSKSLGEAKDAGALTFGGTLANRYVRADEATAAIARLRVGTVAPAESQKAPVNLALVIDTSGSMEGQPIEDARAASMAMIDALAEGDRLAVVAFHSRAEVLLPSTPIDDDNKAEVKARLRAMQAQGTTDMDGGLRAGLEEVNAHLDPRGINRIVLLGDGVPNEEASILSLAASAGSRGVTITALGLGLDFNETLMGAVAQASGGRFHYIERSEDVTAFFQGEVLRLQGVYARNAVVSLTTGPGVRIDSVVGYPMVASGTKVQVSLGDLSRDDKRDLIVRMASDARRDGAPVEILDAVLSFDDAVGGGGRVERRVFLGARATAKDADVEAGRNLDVEDTAASAQAAATTLQAIETARNGAPDRAREMLEQAAEAAHTQSKVNSNAALERKANAMRDLKNALPIAPMPSPPAAPKGASGAAQVRKPIASMPEKAIRHAHDEAMQHF